MRYSDDLIEEVRVRNDIVDVVSGYVKLKRQGSNYFGLCPFHNEKSSSFSVSPAKQMYYCFGCGAGGNVYTFLMEYENYTFTEAVQTLAKRAGVELPEQEMTEEDKRREDLKSQILKMNKLAAGFYYYQLHAKHDALPYRYLTDRQLSEETIKKFGLGYSPKYRDSIYRYLKTKGFSDELIRQSGLVTVDEKNGMYDKFWNRVMFPIMDSTGHVIGFGGRVMGDAKPKYLNSPETKAFDKSRNLYGLNFARTSRKPNMIICEGYMDVIALHQAGFDQAVASLGTALTTQQATLLKRYTDKILVTYDSDEAGVKAAMRAIPILKEAGLSVRVINMRPYKDPDEFIKNLGAAEFQKRIDSAQSSFMYEVSAKENQYDMSDPEGKTSFQKEVARMLLEQFPDRMERTNYMEAVADRYHIGLENLSTRVNELGDLGGFAPATVKKTSQSKKKTEDGTLKSQKLLLTWLIEEPGLFGQVKDYISCDDFDEGFYREIAKMVFEDLESGAISPARIINRFEDPEEQKEAAGLFNARLRSIQTKEEQEKAIAEILYKVKKASIDRKAKELDVTDIEGFQKLIASRNLLKKAGILKIKL